MIRDATFDELMALREAQDERTPFPGATPDPTALAWRACVRDGVLTGAYGFTVLPGGTLFIVEMLGRGFEAVEMSADMDALAKKEGVGLITVVPIGNAPMVDAAERYGWKATHTVLEKIGRAHV